MVVPHSKRPEARDWLAQLARQAQDRAAAHPEMGIEVDWPDTDASVDQDSRRKHLMRSFHRRARGGPAH